LPIVAVDDVLPGLLPASVETLAARLKSPSYHGAISEVSGQAKRQTVTGFGFLASHQAQLPRAKTMTVSAKTVWKVLFIPARAKFVSISVWLSRSQTAVIWL